MAERSLKLLEIMSPVSLKPESHHLATTTPQAPMNMALVTQYGPKGLSIESATKVGKVSLEEVTPWTS